MRAYISILLLITLCSGGILAQTTEQENRRNFRRKISHEQNPEWYKSAEAKEIAENILMYQTKAGAWPKNSNLAVKPESKKELNNLLTGNKSNTIDNGATTTPMRFLTHMINATGEQKYIEAFKNGLNYLLEAQYENGGWPQFYPLRKKGYYSEITYNDNAMMNVMVLLNNIALDDQYYGFIETELKEKSKQALEKGIECILKTQIKVNGQLTAWCAQHDQHTFEPAWARNFEPPSLSGSESVNIVNFLMDIENPSPQIILAVQSAMNWFESSKIEGYRYHRSTAADGKFDCWIEPDDNADPLWARFYDIETNTPIFVGRDKVIHYALSEIERERRTGYAYYGQWPEKLIKEKYPQWLSKHNLTKDQPK